MKNIITILGIFLAGSCALLATDAVSKSGGDPYVMKIYPDGTKVKDGVVPIGTPQGSETKPAPAANAIPTSTSVVTPDQPAKMDYTNADPKDFENAMGPDEGFVFRTAVGAAFQQSLSGRSNDGDEYLSVAFNPGLRFDLEPAYNVTDWFRVGLETAFVYNTVQRLSVGDVNAYPRDNNLGNAGLFQVPILANIRFQFPSEGPWKGYLGGGVGAGWNVFQISALDLTYTSYHWDLMYQLTAGFTYTISPGFDLDIGYKMLSAPNPSFQNSGELGGILDPGQFKAMYNHTVEVGLAWRF